MKLKNCAKNTSCLMIIDGKQLAREIIDGLKNEFAKLPPKAVLTALTAGDNPACELFLKQKQKIAKDLGAELRIIKINEQAGQEGLMVEIGNLNQDNAIGGIIVQLPLPSNFDFEKIAKTIAPQKDVDGFTNTIVKPPAVATAAYLLEKYNVFLENKKIAVVGRGKLVGGPVCQWLAEKANAAAVFIIDKQTAEEKKGEWLKQADIVISGVGKANLIAKDMVKEGVMAIDFGYDIQGGKVCGDISPEVASKASLFTPTPGGTGPILVAMLFRNLLKLIQTQNV